MEHKPRVDLQAIADLSPVESRAPMSRDERLARWDILRDWRLGRIHGANS